MGDEKVLMEITNLEKSSPFPDKKCSDHDLLLSALERGCEYFYIKLQSERLVHQSIHEH